MSYLSLDLELDGIMQPTLVDFDVMMNIGGISRSRAIIDTITY